jgi:2-polyprenyl-3-methyl-5-hydroxy-6-metoxy-1,4-benzoquinol methylase
MLTSVKADWPADGLETLGQCPVCDSAQRSVLHEGLRDNIFFCAPGIWTLWRCNNCRSAYLDPRPTPETIHLAYAKYYTHTPPAPVPAQNSVHRSLTQRLRRTLANGYRNWRYGTEARPANPLGIVAAFVFSQSRRSVDIPFRYLPHPEATGGRRVLDVGFGSGAYLNFAASVGWDACGCDPDPVAVENALARGLNVRQGGIEVWADGGASFDAVTLSHVIEHVHDPKSVLSTVHRILRPGGQLYMDTPNIDALGHSTYGRSWRGLEPPRHLVLYSWGACRQHLRDLGFKSIRSRVRPDTIDNIGPKSARIAEGLDPYSQTQTHMPRRMLRLKSRFSRRRSEFITLTCRKPE